jgi:glutamine---fructose-6-phosphate transaminase (isomerizing)
MTRPKSTTFKIPKLYYQLRVGASFDDVFCHLRKQNRNSMCGIFAYQGQETGAVAKVVKGLKRLEYRGYDSWGVATLSEAQPEIIVSKQVGKISDAEAVGLPAGSRVALAHTRWATHGGVTQVNAHPHLASDGSFALAQNGVVQNFAELKKKLQDSGWAFQSETDTEVIVHLIEKELKDHSHFDLETAVMSAFRRLTGRNTIAVLSTDGTLIAARHGSPLLVGWGKATAGGVDSKSSRAVYVSSDTLSMAEVVDEVLVVENGQLVTIRDGVVKLFEIASGKEVVFLPEKLEMLDSKVDKEGYPHFMLKEVHESGEAIRQVTRQEQEKVEELAAAVRKARQVYVIGSGTAGVAAAQIAYYLRKYGHIAAVNLVGADATEYFELISPKDLLIAPSQSGETADVLEVLEFAKTKKVPIASYVNMQGASMTRLADYPFMAQAGPEISVMSTKIFISQLAWGYLVARTVAGEFAAAQQELLAAAAEIDAYLTDSRQEKTLLQLVADLKPCRDIFLLAKGQLFQVAREGMIKLIEGSYKHAHAIPAGDLKHYAITLMEKDIPVLALIADDEVREDVLTAAHEVAARGATTYGVGSVSVSDGFTKHLTLPFTGPTVALGITVALQLLAYHLTVVLDHDVDHPRHIAKSVTVK